MLKIKHLSASTESVPDHCIIQMNAGAEGDGARTGGGGGVRGARGGGLPAWMDEERVVWGGLFTVDANF